MVRRQARLLGTKRAARDILSRPLRPPPDPGVGGQLDMGRFEFACSTSRLKRPRSVEVGVCWDNVIAGESVVLPQCVRFVAFDPQRIPKVPAASSSRLGDRHIGRVRVFVNEVLVRHTALLLSSGFLPWALTSAPPS